MRSRAKRAIDINHKVIVASQKERDRADELFDKTMSLQLHVNIANAEIKRLLHISGVRDSRYNKAEAEMRLKLVDANKIIEELKEEIRALKEPLKSIHRSIDDE